MCKLKNNICIKTISIFLSVILLVLSPYSKYIDTTSIDKAQATGIAIVEGGKIAIEWIIAYFATLGFGSVAYENREAIAQSYIELETSKDEFNDKIENAGYETCIQVYDAVDGTISNIPWQDFADSFQEGHDYVVDGLTDIYVKLCPELLGSCEDFINSVIYGDTYVSGLSEAIIDCKPITSDDIASQWSGVPYTMVFQGYITQSHSSTHGAESCINEMRYDINVPAVAWISSWSDNEYMFNATYKGIDYNLSLTSQIFSCGYTRSASSSTPICQSYSSNIPVFSDYSDAMAYLRTGEGYKSALNYGLSWEDTITDNQDLPPFYRTWQRQLWEQIANAPDIGIGSYGGALVNDWATDLPFIGLGALEDYITSLQDVYEKTIEDILNGVYDPTRDIPETYEDAWEDTIERTWEDVIEDSKEKTGEKEKVGEKEEEKEEEKEKEEEEKIDPEEIVEDVGGSIGNISDSLKDKFPFSIPWDIQYILTRLASTPKTPHFELPLVIKRYGIDEKLIIDLSNMEMLSTISRTLLSVLFLIGLINLTFKVVGMRKED